MRGSWTTVAIAAAALMTGTSFAQMGAAASGSQTGNVQTRGAATSVSSTQNVQASLNKSLDARSAKVGEEVFAKTTSDFMANGTKVPRGSRLVGHVTDAQARGKGGAESKLGMLFDRVEPRGGGQPIPVSLHIAGIGGPTGGYASGGEQADMDAGVMTPGASANAGARTTGGGGLLGGVGNTVGGVSRGVGSAAGTVTDTTGSALRTTGNVARSTVATAGSTIQGVAISTTGAAGTVLTSTTRDVQLQSGTSLMLTGAASAR